jgi:hypothetical protein
VLTKPTAAVGPTHPRNTDARATLRYASRRVGARSSDDFADDLMTRNQLLFKSRYVALDDMQVGSTHPAGEDTKQEVIGPRLGSRNLSQLKKRLWRSSRR